jgi:hypothetical protein
MTVKRPNIKISPNPDFNNFWKKYGKKILKDSINELDERAKFMITTCAALIVVNLGLITFTTPQQVILVKVSPQFFFIASAILFVISLFPHKRRFNLLSPKSIEAAYYSWLRWKLIMHYAGFALFIAGLIALTVININIPPLSNIVNRTIIVTQPPSK